MTIGCFPAPMAGELLYGVLARHRHLSGARTAANHMIDLFGRKSAVASFDLPCRLDELAARLPVCLGLDARGLLAHTLYPFYTAYQPLQVRGTVEAELRSGARSSAHLRLGAVASRVRAGSTLRFCRTCIERQEEELGVGTWMIAHQLPGMVVCPEHGEVLRDSTVTRASTGRHGYVVADAASCAGGGVAEGVSLRGRSLERLWGLSRAAAALSSSARTAMSLDQWRAHYVERLRGVGLMCSPRRVDLTGLNRSLSLFWGPALPHLPPSCSLFGEEGWAARMVHASSKAAHPLFHLLLDGLLTHLEAGSELPAGEAADEPDLARPVGRPSSRAVSQAAPGRVDWAACDEDLRRDVVAAGVAVRALVPPVRATRAEIERRVARLDWFRRRRDKLPLAVAALDRVAEPLAAFRRRRAEHWAGVFGSDCKAWRVMQAAGLTPDQLPMVREVMSALAAESAAR